MTATKSRNEEPVSGDATAAKSVVPVLIAYHDVAAGKWAVGVLDRLAEGFGGAVDFQPLPWSFNLLADPDGQAEAAGDLVKSDILMLATSSVNSFPPNIEQWVADAIQRKHGTGAAVVALLGREERPEALDSVRLTALKTAAHRAGLGFFAPKRCHQHEETISEIDQRAQAVTPILQGLLHLESGTHRADSTRSA